MTSIIKPVLLAAATSLIALGAAVSPLRAEGLAGSYLAANQANYDNDYQAAARYYARALINDPGNTGLMQNALLAYLSKGDVKQGLAVARRMESLGANSQLAQLVLMSNDVRVGNYDAAKAYFGDAGGFSPLLDGLIQGWIYLGQGKMSDAVARFDEMAANPAMKLFSDYHKALALAVVGDFETAESVMAGDNGVPIRIGRGSLIAHIQMLSQLGRNDEALAIIDDVMNGSGDLEVLAIQKRLMAGETLEFTAVADAQDGAAEVFLTLATVLAGEDSNRFGLIYGRLATYLRPDLVSARLLVAGLLSDQGQFELAVDSYNQVPSDNPSFYSAEIGRAEALAADGKADAGIEVLVGLSKTFKAIPTVFTTLGDALRRESRFAEATAAYNSAIALLPDPQPNQWFLYYARGITTEREGNWDAAEKDFRFALELSPNQPLVLNYLGYGLVEKRIKLDEAQAMIETAVKQRPNDGYITDSLGWVLYRVGKFEQAVPHMERAVELAPVDPIINDHLGDTYWMVGRKLEAEFQWRRALSFEPEQADADRIRMKLEIGLDEVLKFEAENGSSHE